MNYTEISATTPNEIAQKFLHLSNEEIQSAAEHLNSEQLSTAIASLNPSTTPFWKDKTRAIIQGLSNPSQLEVAGRSLSIPQILDIFESRYLFQEDGLNKFLALLVGMNNETFSQLLSHISDDSMDVLVQTSFSEPIQHHLTVFIREMNNRYLIQSDELDKLFNKIENLSIETTGREDLIRLKNNIDNYSLEFQQSLEKMKNGLRIVWNTHRADLIENLNLIKDKYLHTLNNFIGYPENGQSATGLYELLASRLDQVFGNPYDLNNSESLNDNAPSLEALVKFSIWYLKDYWEIGLLPEIRTQEELELDPQTFSEKERAEHREKLFSNVQKHLEKLHLKTLSDLKKEYIYSKKGLIEYIREKETANSRSNIT